MQSYEMKGGPPTKNDKLNDDKNNLVSNFVKGEMECLRKETKILTLEENENVPENRDSQIIKSPERIVQNDSNTMTSRNKDIKEITRTETIKLLTINEQEDSNTETSSFLKGEKSN